jgi:eukaryotic-like serine/threonine-protein kinase
MRHSELDHDDRTGRERPNRLDSWKEIAAYLGRSVQTAQRWEKKEGLPVRRHAHEKQDSVYAYGSELDGWLRSRGLGGAQPEGSAPLRRTTALLASLAHARRLLLTRRVLAPSVALVVLSAAFAGFQFRTSKVRWARQQALPSIEQLIRASNSSRTFFLAYRLADHAQRYIPGDSQLVRLWPAISRTIDIATEPSGADLIVASYAGGDTLHYGVTPKRQARVPRGFLHWRVQKDGYEPVEGVLDAANSSLNIVLDRSGSLPPGMVRATGGKFELALTHLGQQPAFELTDYWIDRYEVTNREFSRFVAAGGYSDSTFWKQSLSKDGRQLPFAEAMRLFRDRTGRPGPATWDAGDFPEGKGDYPVTGVSWYEAMAYAEFAGKSLPTIFHWTRAAGVAANSEIVPLSNFSTRGLAPVGRYRGIDAVGAYDMAGNAKEWCFNSTAKGRFILGGGWNEPLYMFNEADGQSPFARAENFGFRLAKYITPPAPTLLGAVDYPRRDFGKEKPVSDSVFEVIRGLYRYDPSALNAAVDSVDDSHEHWRAEKVSFDAAYGGERVSAYVFLPRHGQPPYETVVYFPGSAGIQTRSSEELQPPYDGAVIKSGRALVFPIYKGTYERGDALNTDYPARTDFYRQHVFAWYKDVGRTLDYIETRRDLDASRIAYFGFSWGARLGPIFLALDPRIKSAVLLSGGLKFAETFPEVDPFNFASRVTVPVLMVNGRYDYYFPLETSQQPLLHLLGTPGSQKRHVVLESGHAPPATPVIKEMLEWLDRYAGPPSR